MAEPTDTRALSAALSGPAFAPRSGGLALHAANRHVERWAPEATADRQRPLRSLGFVDRLVAPWLETAQRSAGLRMFSEYRQSGLAERDGRDVSWVFPRPWYRDELDWMAAAREQAARRPMMLTTRGTYVPPAQQPMPTSVMEYVAPGLSVATPEEPVGYGDAMIVSAPTQRREVYSPLVSLAAVHAAEVMSRTVQRLPATTIERSSALRNVLATMLSRSATTQTEPTRTASMAPELVTPPAPREEREAQAHQTEEPGALQVAERFAAHRAQVVEVQRIARQMAEREYATRVEAARVEAVRAAEVAQRAAVEAPAPVAEQAPIVEQQARVEQLRTEQARIEERVAQRIAERSAAVAHERAVTEQARAAEARGEQTRAIEQRIEQARGEQARVEQARVEQAQQVRGEQARVEQARVEQAQQVRGEQARVEQARVEQAQQARGEQTRAIEQRIEQARAEQARGEERRTGAQRLHEQARVEAAAHARGETMPSVADASVAPAIPPAIASAIEQQIPDQLSAALAALPPELARHLVRRPERAVQAIDELTEAFRTVELIARSAASGTAFEPTRGPRLTMPAGLGGLVTTLDRAHAVERPAMPMQMAMMQAPERALTTRVPTLSWVAPAGARVAPTSALAAAEATQPAALGHVAWADRWLARFAGASQRSLDALTVQHADSPHRLQGLASAAPGAVFVSPAFVDVARDADTVQFDAFGRTVVRPSPFAYAPSTYAPSPTSAPAAAIAPTLTAAPFVAPDVTREVVRYDDNAETPDDVFAAISQAASHARTSPAARAIEPVAPIAPTPAFEAATFERPTIADLLSHEAPSTPGAGLAAQLASSPFAPALRHVLPLPAATSFDVRALLGGALSASYLAGLIVDTSSEVEVASARALPAWSRWAQVADDTTGTAAERFVPSWDATYVAPEMPAAALGDDAPGIDTFAPARSELAPLMTLKSALLAWETTVDASRPDARIEAPAVPAAVTAAARALMPSTARTMVEAMSLPMLGDAAGAGEARESTWSMPGMIANRAQAWSIAQERSSSDLAFDFVTPELVLAARVYGLGPAEAAQAMRLAIVGPGQLSAMAGTVDRTFVQAMAIDSDRRERARIETAYPTSTGATAYARPSAALPTEAELRAEVTAPLGSAFGVERRAPRGAFLWPSATVAALNLHAPAPDGSHAMPVAALELLAAQAVAELGTFAALGESASESTPDAETSPLVRSTRSRAFAPATELTAGDLRGAIEQHAPSDHDVLTAATAMLPDARRARFESLYVALGTTAASRGWSPAARAARALALAGRGDDVPLSARERAATVWDVLPVVYAMHDDANDGAMPMVAGGGTARAATAAARARRGDNFVHVDRPGLGVLSARAGEALGSYVAPSATLSAPRSERSSGGGDTGAVLRVPTAAQEMVQTGRPSGRYGGGEVEIPSWFESAARKMFDAQSSSSSSAGDISIAELTLIQSAPSHQIAASTRSAPSPVSPSMSNATDAKPGQRVDIEKLANEIYRQILSMMDAARARNGEPYL